MNRKFSIAAVVFLLGIAAVAVASELLDAGAILRQIEGSADGNGAESRSAQLLADIKSYRAEAKSLPVETAAKRWFDLVDRSVEIGPPGSNVDYQSVDLATMNVVGIRSVFAALPPPSVWPELRKLAIERTRRDPKNIDYLATRLLTEALVGDPAAMRVTLAQVETAAADYDAGRREQVLSYVLGARNSVVAMYGTREDVISNMTALVTQAASGRSPGSVEVPDLVGMIGVERATELLRKAVTSPMRLHVVSGDQTRRLARRMALENASDMRLPQWGLVDSIDAAELYETLQQRFGNRKADEGMGSAAADDPFESFDSYRHDADVYYLLSTIVAKQQAKAESALIAVSRKDSLRLPKGAVDALRQANQSDALVAFLHGMLDKRPDLQAWDVYIEQSSYVGQSAQALALIRKVRERKGLSAHLRKELQRREAEALLAGNRVDEAIAEMRRQIAVAPQPNDPALLQAASTAVHLARIGRLLQRPELTKSGLGYAEAAIALKFEAPAYERVALVDHIFATYRRTGQAAAAQNLAIKELNRESDDENRQMEQFGIQVASETKRNALIELLGLYGAENRHQDVIELLRGAQQWGARDLAELVAEKDSLGAPAGIVVARALAETGEQEAAIRVLYGLLDRLPGYDPAYELLTKLSGARAVAALDALYARDSFEERPLIWKARLLAQHKELDEAQRVIRRAIAIDPSDGEQGVNDRLRAYAVLADIVEANGDRQNAAIYRKAIEAIRISENADEYHAIGLYDRAFSMYRDALSRFSDAYCIQSRLAIQLTNRGRHAEAVAHYRRAYELMPDSFGRVESHCFGCESVFKDLNAQSIAEEVFAKAIQHDPQKPQSHYLLGYLREEQARYPQALQSFRTAVALDADYLNAWKRLDALAEQTFIDSAERDIARLEMLRLDPRQRHVRYDLSTVRNLSELWSEVERVGDSRTAEPASIYRLSASADRYDAALAKLPPEMRAQMQMYMSFMQTANKAGVVSDPQVLMSNHAIARYAAQLMGAPESYY